MSLAMLVFFVRCQKCGESIVLPRQSPLGKYGDREYQPTDRWPITLLCIAHAQLCGVAPRFRREVIVMPDPGPRRVSLWQIDCECGRENCGKPQTIYTTYLSIGTQEDIARELSKAAADVLPKTACATGLHDLVIRKDKISARILAF